MMSSKMAKDIVAAGKAGNKEELKKLLDEGVSVDTVDEVSVSCVVGELDGNTGTQAT